MNDAGWMEKAGATKGKLALVAVLAVVLVIVVAGQLGGGSTTADVKRPGATSESPATPGRVAVVQPSQESSPASACSNDAPAWPDLSLEDIVRHDPLAVPAWFQTVVPDNGPTEAEDARSQRQDWQPRQRPKQNGSNETRSCSKNFGNRVPKLSSWPATTKLQPLVSVGYGWATGLSSLRLRILPEVAWCSARSGT